MAVDDTAKAVTYYVTRRETCHNLSLKGDDVPDYSGNKYICPECNGTGYIETQVPLLEVLGRLRWNDCGPRELLQQFENLTIEDEKETQ